MYARTALILRGGAATEAAIQQERVDDEKLYRGMKAAKTDAEVDIAVQT